MFRDIDELSSYVVDISERITPSQYRHTCLILISNRDRLTDSKHVRVPYHDLVSNSQRPLSIADNRSNLDDDIVPIQIDYMTNCDILDGFRQTDNKD